MRWFALCLCLLASAASAQVGQIYHPTFEKGAAPPATPGIDAFVDVFGGNSNPVSFPGLTTTHTNDVIIVEFAALASGTPALTISDTAGLTWTQRAVTDPLGFIPVYEYYAVSTGTLSGDVITITFGASTSSFTVGTAVAISGGNTTTPYDVNASLPDPGQTDPGTVSTTAASTIIFMGLRSSNASPTPGTGWTQLVNSTGSEYWIWEYQIVSSAQTNLSVTLGSGTAGSGIGYIADAVQ